MLKKEYIIYTFEKNNKIIIKNMSIEDLERIIEGNNLTGNVYSIFQNADLKLPGGALIKGKRRKNLLFVYKNGKLIRLGRKNKLKN